MKVKRIFHLTSSKNLTAGQRQQLEAEFNASVNLDKLEWTTRALHTQSPVLQFERQFPLFFRLRFLRALYAWIIILKESKEYDLVLLRHMTMDPFSLIFSPLIKNRLSIHHAKEVEELKLIRNNWKGNLASKLESITGRCSVNNTLALIGVTEEIARYQNFTRVSNKKIFSYPNGIDINKISLADDNRENKNVIHIAFVCGTFSEWHGLDLLIDAIEKFVSSSIKINIHLIGKLPAKYLHKLESNSEFVIHGYMSKDQYLKVISKCDIALGSLAMFRQNLHEGSTLKVREMLALGVPIYSTHIDSSLKDNSMFYFKDSDVDIQNMIDFASEMKGYTRDIVRNSTTKYINKREILENLIVELESYFETID